MAAHCDFIAGVFAGINEFALTKLLNYVDIQFQTEEKHSFVHLFLFVQIGACNMFISHPLDTVKTNMQNENMRFVQAARILFKTEGVNFEPFSFTGTSFTC